MFISSLIQQQTNQKGIYAKFKQQWLLFALISIGLCNHCTISAQPVSNYRKGKTKELLQPTAVFKQSSLLDMSADGLLLLFYSTRVPVRVYTFPQNGIPTVTKPPGDDALRVLERISGREIAKHLTANTHDAQFVPRTSEIYYREIGIRSRVKFWDYATGETKTCLEVSGAGVSSVNFISEKTAFGAVYDEKGSKGDFLVKMKLPDCELENIGLVYPVDPQNPLRKNTINHDLQISPDSRLFAYSLQDGEKIILRNTISYEITREISALPIYFHNKEAFTPDGKLFVATAADRNPIIGNQAGDKYYLLVYDTGTWREVARIVVPGNNAIAVSPDGKLVATSYKTKRKVLGGNIEQGHVAIYELQTGKQIGTISHKPVREKRKDPFQSDINKIIFTLDAKQFYTIGRDTYLWSVSQLNPNQY